LLGHFEGLMSTINAFSEIPMNNFHIINLENIAAISKKGQSDHRPISLIHIVPKIIAKAMVVCLSPSIIDSIS
jgi:hypothetical protein